LKLIFDVSDKPKAGQLVVFALQQMLAILAATIAVPLIIGNGLTPAAAMFGAGVGTIVYILFTKAVIHENHPMTHKKLRRERFLLLINTFLINTMVLASLLTQKTGIHPFCLVYFVL